MDHHGGQQDDRLRWYQLRFFPEALVFVHDLASVAQQLHRFRKLRFQRPDPGLRGAQVVGDGDLDNLLGATVEVFPRGDVVGRYSVSAFSSFDRASFASRAEILRPWASRVLRW